MKPGSRREPKPGLFVFEFKAKGNRTFGIATENYWEYHRALQYLIAAFFFADLAFSGYDSALPILLFGEH
jgi:hypothetical protein